MLHILENVGYIIRGDFRHSVDPMPSNPNPRHSVDNICTLHNNKDCASTIGSNWSGVLPQEIFGKLYAISCILVHFDRLWERVFFNSNEFNGLRSAIAYDLSSPCEVDYKAFDAKK